MKEMMMTNTQVRLKIRELVQSHHSRGQLRVTASFKTMQFTRAKVPVEGVMTGDYIWYPFFLYCCGGYISYRQVE